MQVHRQRGGNHQHLHKKEHQHLIEAIHQIAANQVGDDRANISCAEKQSDGDAIQMEEHLSRRGSEEGDGERRQAEHAHHASQSPGARHAEGTLLRTLVS